MVDTGNCNYNVQINEKYGRFLVANKDFEGGDVIFVDTPFVVGPKPGMYCDFVSKYIYMQKILHYCVNCTRAI